MSKRNLKASLGIALAFILSLGGVAFTSSPASAAGFSMAVVGSSQTSLTIDWGNLRTLGDVEYVELSANGISTHYVNAQAVTRWEQKRLLPATTYHFTGKLYAKDKTLLGTATASGTTQAENSAPVVAPPDPNDNVVVGSANLAFNGATSSSLSFSWNHTGYVGDIAGGYVARLIDSNGKQVAVQNVGNAKSVTFTNLPAGTRYSMNLNVTVRSYSGKKQITLVSGYCVGTTAANPAPVAPEAPTVTTPAPPASSATPTSPAPAAPSSNPAISQGNQKTQSNFTKTNSTKSGTKSTDSVAADKPKDTPSSTANEMLDAPLLESSSENGSATPAEFNLEDRFNTPLSPPVAENTEASDVEKEKETNFFATVINSIVDWFTNLFK